MNLLIDLTKVTRIAIVRKKNSKRVMEQCSKRIMGYRLKTPLTSVKTLSSKFSFFPYSRTLLGKFQQFENRETLLGL